MLVEYLLMLSLLVVLVLVAFGMYVEPLGEIYTNIEETFHNITHGIRF